MVSWHDAFWHLLDQFLHDLRIENRPRFTANTSFYLVRSVGYVWI